MPICPPSLVHAGTLTASSTSFIGCSFPTRVEANTALPRRDSSRIGSPLPPDPDGKSCFFSRSARRRLLVTHWWAFRGRHEDAFTRTRLSVSSGAQSPAVDPFSHISLLHIRLLSGTIVSDWRTHPQKDAFLTLDTQGRAEQLYGKAMNGGTC